MPRTPEGFVGVAVSGYDHSAAVAQHAVAMAEERRIKLSPWVAPRKKVVTGYVPVTKKKKCVPTGKHARDAAEFEKIRERVCELYFKDEMRITDIASLLELRRTYVSTVVERQRQKMKGKCRG
jgi:hypothetical protein